MAKSTTVAKKDKGKNTQTKTPGGEPENYFLSLRKSWNWATSEFLAYHLFRTDVAGGKC